MSIGRRISRIVRAKRTAVKEKSSDPIQTVDDAHRQQLDLVDKARRSVADLAANRHRLELLAGEAGAELDRLDRQASDAVNAGDDDGARAALRRSQTVAKRLETLTRQRDALDVQVRQLDSNLQRLETRVEDNGLRYQTLKARHGAAQAELGMQDALAGSGQAAAGAEAAARQAELEARRVQAQAAAHDELSWSDPNSRRIEEAFEELEASSAADRELERLKKRRPGD
ncbi:PspA/IM30 family protein [Arthrobacter sp. H20]|uniref:PspA/IM30 family protein n=1 Tax=Arthrobacter sp. H20 TaxID=1267981 RepID=UPI00047D74D9|nr:PspA/IM30 family protein [Arthrobacter sp. H20]